MRGTVMGNGAHDGDVSQARLWDAIEKHGIGMLVPSFLTQVKAA